jgi:hypothetical protein
VDRHLRQAAEGDLRKKLFLSAERNFLRKKVWFNDRLGAYYFRCYVVHTHEPVAKIEKHPSTGSGRTVAI